MVCAYPWQIFPELLTLNTKDHLCCCTLLRCIDVSACWFIAESVDCRELCHYSLSGGSSSICRSCFCLQDGVELRLAAFHKYLPLDMSNSVSMYPCGMRAHSRRTDIPGFLERGDHACITHLQSLIDMVILVCFTRKACRRNVSAEQYKLQVAHEFQRSGLLGPSNESNDLYTFTKATLKQGDGQ